jgi:glyoxylase-like metal-dependent hydrolase (beta-lactamase superfamily II)
MHFRVIPCGFLRVRAVEMIKPWFLESIRQKYTVDTEGFMKLAMNAFLVKKEEHVVLIDPGAAEFLPSGLKQEYGLEIPVPLVQVLQEADVNMQEITDVIFTHIHFDHASGAFKRIPGNIVKRFPNARYHVLKEHYDYAQKPDRIEANSFSMVFFRRLDKIHWLEDWNHDWMNFKIFKGHTRGMVVPEISTGEGKIYFVTDLIPMEVFLEPEVYCGYDLDPELQMQEKQEFLEQIEPGSRLILFHDTLKESVFYS